MEIHSTRLGGNEYLSKGFAGEEAMVSVKARVPSAQVSEGEGRFPPARPHAETTSTCLAGTAALPVSFNLQAALEHRTTSY